jgi:hypothetical protein
MEGRAPEDFRSEEKRVSVEKNFKATSVKLVSLATLAEEL